MLRVPAVLIHLQFLSTIPTQLVSRTQTFEQGNNTDVLGYANKNALLSTGAAHL